MGDMERDEMDDLLKSSLRQPAPRLSEDFERRLHRRLYPPSLSSRARTILGIYAAAAIVVSIFALRTL
jgi:hypothetical protein